MPHYHMILNQTITYWTLCQYDVSICCTIFSSGIYTKHRRLSKYE